MDVLGHKRTITSLLLAMCALGLGLIAQGYLAHPGSPLDGLLVYGLAALVFAAAVLRTPVLPGLSPRLAAARQSNTPLAQRGIGYAAWSTVLLFFAGMATVLALILFASDQQPLLRWAFHLTSIVLFLVAARSLSRAWAHHPDRASAPAGLGEGSGGTTAARTRWLQAGLLILIVLLGLFLRLYRFKELPYGLWYDESDNGLWARQILADPNFRPVYVPSTNLPAHFLYLIALSFRLLGDSMYAIRAVAVAFGVLTIVAAYFFGREFKGTFFGLVLAFLLAVSRWDVNWSRIGMHGVTVPFFELWIAAALLRGLRTRQLASFAWVGVALGLGLCFYTPVRIFPAVLLPFLLAWGLGWWRLVGREHPGWSWANRARHALATWSFPALLVVVGTLIVVAPVAQFALHYPDVFWDRAKRISLFQYPEVQAHPVQAVLDSTAKHLLMFNYRGDPNGRHNLPSAPMLGQLGGVLFVLGVVLSIVRWRDARSILLLAWLLIPLSGGIFSTWFEAPQSLRSIGSLPAVYLLMGVTMEWFGGEWRRVFPRPASSRRLATAGIVLLAAIGVENGFTYFYLQGRDFASWAAFNPAETRLAQDINLYRDDYDLRFDPLLTAHLTTRYLAPDYRTYHDFDAATVFPIQGTDKKGVLLFSAPDSYPFRGQAEALYPGVQTETFVHPYTGRPVLYRHFITRQEIAAVQGLDARYVPLQAGQGNAGAQAQLPRVDPQIDFAWAGDPPLAYPFEAVWNGGLLAPEYGVYTLHVDAPGEYTLHLDDRVVLSGPGPQERQIVMAEGVHALYLDCQVAGPGTVRLAWATPGDATLRPVPQDALYRSSWPIRGLVGRFYPNDNWSGDPALVRIDRQVAYYFHFLSLPRPYTVEWTGRLAVPVSGAYRLGVSAISSASLYVDDQPLIENSPLGQFQDAEIYLAAGMHDIRLRFLDDWSHSQVYLYWQLPTGIRELIPFDALFLPGEGTWWPTP
jgi:hypothetical protein